MVAGLVAKAVAVATSKQMLISMLSGSLQFPRGIKKRAKEQIHKPLIYVICYVRGARVCLCLCMSFALDEQTLPADASFSSAVHGCLFKSFTIYRFN